MSQVPVIADGSRGCEGLEVRVLLGTLDTGVRAAAGEGSHGAHLPGCYPVRIFLGILCISKFPCTPTRTSSAMDGIRLEPDR